MIKKGVIVITLILCLFSACAKQQAPEPVGQDVLLYTQVKGRVSEKKVAQLEAESADLNEFCNALNISQYKKTQDESYVVIKTGKGLFLVMFDENGVCESRRGITFSKNDGAAFFASLQIGKTALETVQAAEPDGQYDFLYAGWSGFPKYSFHFFENGDCFNLWYENDVLTEIIHFTI